MDKVRKAINKKREARKKFTDTAGAIAGTLRMKKEEDERSITAWFKKLMYGIFKLLMIPFQTIAFIGDLLIDVAESLNFATQVLYLVLSVWGLVYVSNLDLSVMISQNEQHVGLFILMSQSFIFLFSVFGLIMFTTLMLVKIFENKALTEVAVRSVFKEDADTFGDKYSQFIAPLQHHMLTVIIFSSIFIYVNEDLKTKLSGITGDQWLIPFIIIIGVLRSILEFRHSRDARNKKTKAASLGSSIYELESEYDNKPMRGPALLLSGILLFYNVWYGDGFDNGYSFMFNVALIVYIVFVAYEKWMVAGENDELNKYAPTYDDRFENGFEWGYGKAWASIGLASTVMVILSAMNVAERINKGTTVEGALVAALGAIVLDVSRLGYGSKSDNSEVNTDVGQNKILALVFRAVHALVGVVGLLSVYAKETIDDAKLGVVEPLRLFVVVASLVKVVGFFYSFRLPPKFGIVPQLKENVENTLRQGSTIVLLMSSILLENITAEDNATGWGTAILSTAIVARLVDCIQDSILDFGLDNYSDYLLGNWGKQGENVLSPSVDNPRSWLVLGGLVTALVLIIQVTDLENKATDPGDSNKLLDGSENDFNGWLICSLVLVLVHALLVFVSIISSVYPSSDTLKSISLSRLPLIRTTVTTTVLIGLTVCAGQINLGYDEVPSTSPSPSTDFTPNQSQLNLLAAIVVYIFTDLVGHVFL